MIVLSLILNFFFSSSLLPKRGCEAATSFLRVAKKKTFKHIRLREEREKAVTDVVFFQPAKGMGQCDQFYFDFTGQCHVKKRHKILIYFWRGLKNSQNLRTICVLFYTIQRKNMSKNQIIY